MTDDDVLADLIALALEKQHETGDAVAVEEICKDRPDLAEDVSNALEFAERLPGLQRAAVGGGSWVGTVVDRRYRIDERLGSGAMGVVWRAWDLDLERMVALKVVSGAAFDSETAAGRFQREAGALAAIQHDAIVTIFDRGATDDGNPYLVMEVVDGVPLSTLLDAVARSGERIESSADVATRFGIGSLEEPSFIRQAVRWVAELASGVQTAHDAGVAHRDIKPSNVMIRHDGRAVLLDFGIAAVEGDSTLTNTEAAIGTPAYMAPEALRGRSELPHSQDVYGLSATLYHLVTQKAPYEGGPSEVLTALATREPVPAVRVRPGLPRDLQAILDAGMARAVADRYASAHHMESDLRAFLALEPVSVRPVSPTRRVARRLRRSRWMAGAMTVAALVTVFMLGRTWSQHATRTTQLRWQAAWAAIPANLTVTIPVNRRPAEETDVQAMLAALDAVVRVGVEPVTGHALRGSFRLDIGDLAGAISDFDAIATSIGTPYARALAAAYAGLPHEDAVVANIDLAALPAPETGLDHYLAGYHELRQMRRAEALAHFVHEELTGTRHARELAVLCSSLEIDKFNPRTQRAEQDRAASAMLEGALQVERDFQWRSAMTAHLAGSALGVMRNWSHALEAAEASLTLCNHSLVARQNAAHFARMLGQLDLAVEHVKVAVRLAPQYAPLYDTWVRAEASAGHYESADAILAGADFLPTSLRVELQAIVDLNQSLDAKQAGDRVLMAKQATKAISLIDAADPNARRSKLQKLKVISAALQKDDPDGLFNALLQQDSLTQLDVGLLRDLVAEFPTSIPDVAAPDLKRLLQAVIDGVVAGTLSTAAQATGSIPAETR